MLQEALGNPKARLSLGERESLAYVLASWQRRPVNLVRKGTGQRE